MKSNLLFDFIVNKETNELIMKREFAAGRQLVWDCYTKQELLEQWFAPKPMTTRTRSMEFREGGHWHYAMVDPDGKEYWGYTEYVSITPIEEYISLDAFSDETGTIDPELPRASWILTFKDARDHTFVETVVTYESLEDLETVIKMGMKDGMTSTLEKLDELLKTLPK
jgi:uncharacterized protein YndB with AHSA1/START domain